MNIPPFGFFGSKECGPAAEHAKFRKHVIDFHSFLNRISSSFLRFIPSSARVRSWLLNGISMEKRFSASFGWRILLSIEHDEESSNQFSFMKSPCAESSRCSLRHFEGGPLRQNLVQAISISGSYRYRPRYILLHARPHHAEPLSGRNLLVRASRLFAVKSH